MPVFVPGIISEPGTRLILKLKNNPNLRNEMGQFGKNRAINEFSWQNQAKDLVEFIKMKI